MKLVKVFTAAGYLESEMIKGFLQAQEIEVWLNQESVGRTLGLSGGPLGEVDVLVPEQQVDRAQEVLREMFRGEFELDEGQPDLPDEDFPPTDDTFDGQSDA